MKIISIIVLAMLLCSCASVGRKLDQTKVEQIKNGQTRQDVVNLIGSPDQIVQNGGFTIFQYMYVHSSAKPASFIPLVGAFAGGVDTQNQMVRVTFNQDNIVTDVFKSYGGTEMTTGMQTGSSASLPATSEDKRPK